MSRDSCSVSSVARDCIPEFSRETPNIAADSMGVVFVHPAADFSPVPYRAPAERPLTGGVQQLKRQRLAMVIQSAEGAALDSPGRRPRSEPKPWGWTGEEQALQGRHSGLCRPCRASFRSRIETRVPEPAVACSSTLACAAPRLRRSLGDGHESAIDSTDMRHWLDAPTRFQYTAAHKNA